MSNAVIDCDRQTDIAAATLNPIALQFTTVSARRTTNSMPASFAGASDDSQRRPAARPRYGSRLEGLEEARVQLGHRLKRKPFGILRRKLAQAEAAGELPFASDERAENNNKRDSSGRKDANEYHDDDMEHTRQTQQEQQGEEAKHLVALAHFDQSVEPDEYYSGTLTQAGEQTYGSRVVGVIFMITLPLLGCIILALILCFIYRFCRKFNQFSCDKSTGDACNAGNKSSIFKRPISFISSAKLFGSALSEKRRQDKRQLTLNMELDNNSDVVTDCEEQIIKSRAAQRKSSFCGNRSMTINITGLNNKQKIKNVDSIKGECYGNLKYTLDYNFEESTLEVTVAEAHGLPGMDLCGSSDPYVRVELLSSDPNNNKQMREKTRVHRKTLDPIFNETFKFDVPYVELTRMTLQLSVFDYDRFSKHDEIGQVIIPINSIDLSQTIEQCADLKRLSSRREAGQVSTGNRLSLHEFSCRPTLTTATFASSVG